MEINRYQYMTIGMVILLLGIQLRMIDSFVLTESTSRFIAERVNHEPVPTAFSQSLLFSPPASKRTVQPPKWLGWALVSVGGVLVLHSLAMRRTG